MHVTTASSDREIFFIYIFIWQSTKI